MPNDTEREIINIGGDITLTRNIAMPEDYNPQTDEIPWRQVEDAIVEDLQTMSEAELRELVKTFTAEPMIEPVKTNQEPDIILDN